MEKLVYKSTLKSKEKKLYFISHLIFINFKDFPLLSRLCIEPLLELEMRWNVIKKKCT